MCAAAVFSLVNCLLDCSASEELRKNGSTVVRSAACPWCSSARHL
jgi:hypothetical protein